MIEKGVLKYIKGGVVSEINNKTTADMVIYDNNGTDTTLEKVLDSFSSGRVPHSKYADIAEKTEKDLSGNVISETYLTLSNAEMTGTPTAPEYEGTDSCVYHSQI